MNTDERFEAMRERLERELEGTRLAFSVLQRAPDTGFKATDAAVAERVRLLENSHRPHVLKLLQELAGAVGALLLEGDSELQREHVLDVERRHATSSLAQLLAAVDEQVATARWWLTETAV